MKKAIISLAALASTLPCGAYDLTLGKQTFSFHGFASQGYVQSDSYNYFGNTSDGTGQFTEVGLNASWSPFNRTRIAAQGFTYDLGEVGNFELMLDYATVEYTFNDYIGIRGGRVRRQQGIYNHILDVDLARTSIFLPQAVYDARWRDFTTSVDGGTIFGNIPLGKAGSLSYELYGGMMRLSKEGGIHEQSLGGVKPFGVQQFDKFEGGLIYGGQLWWNTPVSGLRSGLSIAQSDGIVVDATIPAAPPFVPFPAKSHSEVDNPITVASLEYLTGPWTFQAEYITVNNIQHRKITGMPDSSTRSRSDGWYGLAAYRFNKYVEVGAYHSQSYQNVANRDFSNPGSSAVKSRAYQLDSALSLRLDLTDWWVFKLEGHYIKGTSLLYNTYGQNPTSTQDRGGWWMFAAKTTFSF